VNDIPTKDGFMPSHRTRISIIGSGPVGTSYAFALLQKHLVREIVLIGDGPNHVQGEALDLQQAVPLGTPITVTVGTYKDAAASAVVIITVGTPGKFQGSRLDMLRLAEFGKVITPNQHELADQFVSGVREPKIYS
jgi:malate/lactate dehydrogenase